MRLLMLGVALALAANGQRPIPGARLHPSEPPQFKPEDRGSVSGQVLNSATGEPVRKAKVTLSHTGGAGALVLQTDASGNFAAEQLAPGQYVVAVEAPGFVGMYRQQPDQIDLPPASRKSGVVMKLQPQAVVTGRVLDEDGDPLMRVQVMAVSVRDRKGRFAYGNGAGGMTNDLGEFRLAGLAPGSYYVIAQSLESKLASVVSPSTARTRRPMPVPTYHPSALDAASAVKVRVTPGADLRGIDVRIRTVESVRVSGRLDYVLSAVQLGSTHMMLSPARSRGLHDAPWAAPVHANGTFEFNAVSPGDYMLWTQIPAMSPGELQRNLTGRLPIRVDGSDIKDLVVQVREPIEIAGKLKNEGEELDLNKLMATLHAEDMGPSGPPTAGGAGKINGDGRFLMLNVAPGNYRLNLHGDAPDHYLKAATFAGRDILKDGLDLTAPGELAITIASDGGRIKGKVVMPETETSDRVLVAVWPAGEDRVQLHRISFAEPVGGDFELRGIPPGSYRLIAVRFALNESPDFNDSESLKELDEKAESIDVAANSRLTRQLKLVTLSEGE